MNDLSSLGFHRAWKQELINWIAPQSNQSLLDIAGGTGDIAKLFIESGGNSADIIDINYNMLINGISSDNRIRYIIGNCEKLPIKNNVYDRITIAFGLRNVTDRQLALDEIYRVLKPGGRFICLEFSMVNDTIVKKFYDLWSFKVIPKLGKIITNNVDAYKYLIESIRMFPDQDQLSSMFIKSKFERVKYRNLSKGIASLHSGWKF
jgi:demethylmenaquinone methyltransferase/2-methoxy-6-polyprenyl-1,4-benzoquinol methylase